MLRWLLTRVVFRPWHWLRCRLGLGRSVAELASRLEMSVDNLRTFQPKYRQASIAKRTGGVRHLSIPSDETKALQRRLLARVLRGLRAHPAACAYERGRSITNNAAPHVGRAVVVKLDVVDFFPATHADRIERYFRRIGWNREAARLLTKLTTYQDGLPQGAPTSPRLSNLVNFSIDVRLERLAARRRARYTRYADDITFSVERDQPRRVRGIVQSARRILKVHGYELHRNKKLKILRRHHQQLVTGLVVNERLNVPRRKRRQLRAVLHRLKTGRNATMTPEQLAGWKGVLDMVANQSNRPG